MLVDLNGSQFLLFFSLYLHTQFTLRGLYHTLKNEFTPFEGGITLLNEFTLLNELNLSSCFKKKLSSVENTIVYRHLECNHRDLNSPCLAQ